MSSVPHTALHQKSNSTDQLGNHRARDQSSDTPEMSTAPAVDPALTASADERETAPAESPLTEINSEPESRLNSEKVYADDSSPNNTEEEDNTVETSWYATPRIDNTDLIGNDKLSNEENCRRARVTYQEQKGQDGLTREQSEMIELARNNMTPA